MKEFFNIHDLETKLGVIFRDKELLMLAFIHRSFWNENQDKVSNHNERLEFLGDSVLGLLVANHLFCHLPSYDEGPLSNLRSQLVDAPACAMYIQKLEIEKYLLLGKGEQMNRGKGRESILADLFEALVGALYLDQGLEAVQRFFFSHFQQEVDHLIAEPQRNWKADLQDYAQKNYQETPLYEVLEEGGPAHRKVFRVGVWIHGKKMGEGAGSSKKEAQTQAAKEALIHLQSLIKP